jgi:hypothetical protein
MRRGFDSRYPHFMKKRITLFTPEEKNLILSVLKKTKTGDFRVVSFPALFRLLSSDEKLFAKKILKIDPTQYGSKVPYLGISKVPASLVAVKNQKYFYEEKMKKIATQYVPKLVFGAYQELNRALFKETGRKICIESGYRSPAYQLIVFLRYLHFYDFDLKQTIQRSALPGYSEHGFPKRQALDFINQDGIPDDLGLLDFSKTLEYKWLTKNADTFGFFLSYPQNNKLGMIFEPWHWHFGS